MEQQEGVWSYSAVLMGSPVLLKLFRHDPSLAARTFRLIKRYEDLFTVNRTPSQVMDINLAAGQHPVVVSRPVYELIACAKAASLVRGGCFNLAIGRSSSAGGLVFATTMPYHPRMNWLPCWR
jgi:thiamine biosynthesis lipoprotein